jgi:hypothetical protein
LNCRLLLCARNSILNLQKHLQIVRQRRSEFLPRQQFQPPSKARAVDDGEDRIPSLDQIAAPSVAEYAKAGFRSESGQYIANQLITLNDPIHLPRNAFQIKDGFEVAIPRDQPGLAVWKLLSVSFASRKRLPS